MQIHAAKGKLDERRVSELFADTVEEAFKLLDAGGYDVAFIEFSGVQLYLDAMAFVPSRMIDKMKTAQLVGMREVVCWQQGAIWALPNWTWRVAYMKAPAAVPVATVARPRG